MRNLWLALCFAILGLAPAQAQGVDPTVNPPVVFPGIDGASLFVRLEPTQVFWDDFGTGTLDTTNRWNAPTTSGGGTAASNAVGFSTLGSGTTASGWSKLTSVPTFVGRNPGYITMQHQVNLELPILTNAYRFWGMGSIAGSPTTTSPMTNAVGWAIDTSGKLRAQTWASGSINFNADLSVIQSGPQLCSCIGQPQDSSVHKYQIYFRGDNILWFIDGKPVARVNTGAGGPDVNTLGVAALAVAGGTPPTSTATITLNQVTIGDSSRNATAIRDATLPWLQMKVNADGSIAAGGVSVSNASSGVATTSTNAPTVSYNYGFNGTTWDQLRTDTTGGLWAQGAVASGATDSGNPVKVGGVASSGTPTAVSSGQRVNNWMSINGALMIGGVQVTPSDGIANGGFGLNLATGGGSSASLSNYVNLFNGTTWDRGRSINGAVAAGTGDAAVAIAPTSVAAAGITPVVSASAEATHVLKASAGNLYSVYAINLTATAGFLTIINATSAPGDGAQTPLACVPLPANGNAAINFNPGPAQVYSTGITAIVTSATTCFTKTTGVITAFISGSVQ